LVCLTLLITAPPLDHEHFCTVLSVHRGKVVLQCDKPTGMHPDERVRLGPIRKKGQEGR
jgi:hypothetical protein